MSSTPFGCAAGSHCSRVEIVVGSPSMASVATSRSDQPTMRLPRVLPTSSMRTWPTQHVSSSTVNPARCHASGSSATVIESIVGPASVTSQEGSVGAVGEAAGGEKGWLGDRSPTDRPLVLDELSHQLEQLRVLRRGGDDAATESLLDKLG